jgi:hypothetical protein
MTDTPVRRPAAQAARTPTKGPSRPHADGSSARDEVRTTPASDIPGRVRKPRGPDGLP